MYGCAVPIVVAEPAAEVEGATVKDVAPEATIPEAMVVPLAAFAAQVIVDTPSPVPARTIRQRG